MTPEILHAHARGCAATLRDPDRKHLRFNEIVTAARRFYPANELAGVKELVEACDRANPELYYRKSPMWRELSENFGWMIGKGK